MQTLRTFIAIHLPEQLIAALGDLIAGMPPETGAVKWVKPESIHITLKFLGDIRESQRPEIESALENACATTAPFALASGQPGAFANWRKPNVFWVGVTGSKPDWAAMLHLQSAIETQLEAIGFPRENRRFKPHLTIGRVKNPHQTAAIVEHLRAKSFPEIAIPVASVHLMKSELTRQGAIYFVLKSVNLQKT